MRALLIVNPHATSTTQLRRDVIVRALSSAVELEVVQTRYRGHATALAAAAAGDGFGLVLTLGGDGTVNEVVNGILSPDRPIGGPAAGARGAARRQRERLHPGHGPAHRPRGRDRAGPRGPHRGPFAQHRRWAGPDDRYFTFNAGLGLDAEVVRAVDGQRARGRMVTPALYLRMTLRQYYRVTDRRHPALMLEMDGQPPGRAAIPRHRL